MSWTKAQKLAATLSALKSYRFGLAPTDPDVAEADAIIHLRNIDQDYYLEVTLPQYIIAADYARKNGEGPGGLDDPPKPPPIP